MRDWEIYLLSTGSKRQSWYSNMLPLSIVSQNFWVPASVDGERRVLRSPELSTISSEQSGHHCLSFYFRTKALGHMPRISVEKLGVWAKRPLRVRWSVLRLTRLLTAFWTHRLNTLCLFLCGVLSFVSLYLDSSSSFWLHFQIFSLKPNWNATFSMEPFLNHSIPTFLSCLWTLFYNM